MSELMEPIRLDVQPTDCDRRHRRRTVSLRPSRLHNTLSGYYSCLNVSYSHTHKSILLLLLLAASARAQDDHLQSIAGRASVGEPYHATTLGTPMLTTYRYSDGNNEWLSVDLKKPEVARGAVDFEQPEESYGADLEKDHTLPTSAPAAEILKNNNNKNYNNPNRYNNDRLKPELKNQERATENVFKATTSYSVLKNVRPTKSMYSKDIPSYVPPSRVLFTPPLPPEFLSPFADKPTLRGTNSDSFINRRPIPPPSLMPNKDRIPFRPPDLPPSKAVNVDKVEIKNATATSSGGVVEESSGGKNDRKKMLNTPSQNVRYGEFYRNLNESNFEYEKSYVPTITRILSGSNGRQDDIPDILLRTVTATPNVQKPKPKIDQTENTKTQQEETTEQQQKPETVTLQPDNNLKIKKEVLPVIEVIKDQQQEEIITTQISDVINLPNVKNKESNVTKATSDEIWLICWNVHVYLVVIGYILLAIYSIYKLIRYENDPHMFSKSYFLTIHLMLTVICVLRIFYLTYDPYNFDKSFNIFLYDFLHNFPLSLLATTFAVLILFLLKRTLTHLEVKTRPVFLVVFGLIHIFLCFCMSILESVGQLQYAGVTVCKPVFILLAWALGVSYLYLYRIIKNVLAKKSQNLSEMCTQNISYASHITIAVALLFVLLGFVQLYALFFIKVDRFNGEIKHHWILWGFELSVRFLEISIITLLAIVVSLKMSQREKQTVGFPLFPCTTSDSSTDNIYPNNCNTNPNALNYTRTAEINLELPSEPDRPNILKTAFHNDSFDKKSTLERFQQKPETTEPNHFERPKWTSDNFERSSSRTKVYESAKYYAKPRYDDDYHHHHPHNHHNVYSEPIDNNDYEFERSDFERRSRNSSNTSGRRSTGGRTRKSQQQQHARPHLGGVQTLPPGQHQLADSMLVDDQGFVRFRHLQEERPRRGSGRKGGEGQYSDA